MSAYGHDDLDDDASNAAMAARDADDPRASLGYEATLAPRTVKPPPGVGHFAIAWIPGEAPRDASGPVGGERICRTRDCGPATTLHADPDSTDPRRVLCGKCCGEVMRRRVGWAQAKEPT